MSQQRTIGVIGLGTMGMGMRCSRKNFALPGGALPRFRAIRFTL